MENEDNQDLNLNAENIIAVNEVVKNTNNSSNPSDAEMQAVVNLVQARFGEDNMVEVISKMPIQSYLFNISTNEEPEGLVTRKGILFYFTPSEDQAEQLEGELIPVWYSVPQLSGDNADLFSNELA